MTDFDRESMLEMFIFEMTQLIDQLESTIIQSESEYNIDQINEIFRIMHTIKGSSAMMMFDNMAGVAHSIEDLFYFLREESPTNVNFSRLSDLVLSGADFVKAELAKIQDGEKADSDGSQLALSIEAFLKELKGGQGGPAAPAPAKEEPAPAANAPEPPGDPASPDGGEEAHGKLHRYKAKIFFQEGCEMENIRAYTLVHNMSAMVQNMKYVPEDVIDEETIPIIRKNGFFFEFSSPHDYDAINKHLSSTVYLRELELQQVGEQEEEAMRTQQTEEAASQPEAKHQPAQPPAPNLPVTPQDLAGQAESQKKAASQTMISVNVNKLDGLLNLMGELVIAEAMVTQNSELAGMQLDNFNKEARQLQKTIENLHRTVMSMRMVPLSATFFRMHRIVRDMCRQLGKDVTLEIVGEETEVDKNIIEHIADPIMHIIRNSIDHGVEYPQERAAAGKPPKAIVVLEAKSVGGEVHIIIRDDGRGINTEKVLKKAVENGLLTKPESEYTEKEIQQFIFLPGFSTNEQVTAFSGRGVGMDVVNSNLEVCSGSALVDSVQGAGTTFTLRIPLTLSITMGMSVLLAGAQYTLPISSIIKSFKAKPDKLFSDPNGNEMITERGEIFNIVRLHDFFNVSGAVTDVCEGTLVMIENGNQVICLLVDDLIGQQQAVVKPLPKYFKKVRGLSGCTLLGNGEISLIIDVAGFYDK